MAELIDLSQDIYEGMPVFHGLPQVKIGVHATHEEWEGMENADTETPAVLRMELGEHTGTHVDALNHMGREFAGQSIDTMPLALFYTEGICLDFSHKGLSELIGSQEIEASLQAAGLGIQAGDTVLFCTRHYERHLAPKTGQMVPA